jgi:putative tryptophan/tyrosine transport system substrate-binding protein
MNRAGLVTALTTSLLVAQGAAEAQAPAKLPRIGFLTAVPLAVMSARTGAFRRGLRELGYVEGQTILIEWRSADGRLDRLPALAAELVRLKVDVIVTGGPSATRPTKAATATIPIVITNDNDPVANGFVASLARPGGNIADLSTLSPELYGKQLELLKEIVPTLSRVAVLGDSAEPGHAQALREAERAARTLRVQLQYLDVHGPNDIEPAFRAARTGRADAVLTLTSAVLASNRQRVIDLAGKIRLPVMYFLNAPGFPADGGLMSYGASVADNDRRAATFVHKILKGANPSDLPIEQPTKFDLVLNLKAAKQIGLTIPPFVLARADQVIN